MPSIGTTAAIVGCGDISSVHFDVLDQLPDVRLVAVVDKHPGRLAAASVAHAVPGYGGLVEMLDRERPTVVHICTPHSEHAWMAIACLDRGVNVVLEKPLASTLEEGRALVEAAARSRAQIAVCFQNRYNRPVQAMRAAIESGEIGAIVAAHATVIWHRTAEYFLDRPWRGTWSGGGGGLLMNQAIHTLDLLQWLVGAVDTVAGSTSTRVLAGVIEVEDTAEIMLTHASGVTSLFYATLANGVNSPVTIDIVTERAVLQLRGNLTVTHDDGTVNVVADLPGRPGERSYWGISHEALIRDFYDQLGAKTPFWIDPAEALKSLRIIQDVYAQSSVRISVR